MVTRIHQMDTLTINKNNIKKLVELTNNDKIIWNQTNARLSAMDLEHMACIILNKQDPKIYSYKSLTIVIDTWVVDNKPVCFIGSELLEAIKAQSYRIIDKESDTNINIINNNILKIIDEINEEN